jgi:hypothetical protein
MSDALDSWFDVHRAAARDLAENVFLENPECARDEMAEMTAALFDAVQTICIARDLHDGRVWAVAFLAAMCALLERLAELQSTAGGGAVGRS